jgi:hypothetical protein
MLDSGNEIGIGNKGQIAECFIQVSRTDLAGSPRTAYHFSEADFLPVIHELLFPSSAYFSSVEERSEM